MPALSGYCKSCGLCCSRPFVLPEEKEAIAEKLGFLKGGKLKPVGDHFIIDSDPCVFLKNGECSIEAVKPVCCRVFPLVLQSEGREFHWVVSENCPMKRQIPADYVRKAEAEGRRLLEYHNNLLGL